MGAPKRIVAAASLIAGLAVVVASTSSSSAGASTASSSGKGAKIAFACATPALNSFYAPFEAGAADAAKQLGVSVTYTGLSAVQSAAAEAQVVQAAINTHPAALIVCNFFPRAITPLIRQAIAARIPVFDTGNNAGPAAAAGALATVGQNDYLGGQDAALRMIAAGVKHPLCVDQVPDNPDVASRCQGFAAEYTAHRLSVKNLNIPTLDLKNVTLQISDMKGVLSADQSLDGMIELGPEQGPAGVQAWTEAGRSNPGSHVATFDMSTNIANEIRSGQLMFAIWQQPYLEGYLPVVLATLYLAHGYAPPGEVLTGPTIVTKSNLAIVKTALAKGQA